MISIKISSIKRSNLRILLALILISALNNFNAFGFQEQEINFTEYKGEVLDEASKKPLIFATLAVQESNITTVTNTEGQFSLKIPEEKMNSTVLISFLGYKTRLVPISQLNKKKNKIFLTISVTELAEINISAPKNAESLVRETLTKKGKNYFDDPTLMTAFYRETIKKRRKNVSLSEAVVNIYKTPYTSHRNDAVQLYKARKSTDYTKMDTVALKLQGGPFNALYIDIMKYPEFIFSNESLDDYTFSFDSSTRINNKLIYVINFKQKSSVQRPMYKGKLYIDQENKILTSAIYSLNITNKDDAARMFVRRKPRNAKVWPTEIAYRVDYREKNNKWYYGYSNVLLEFKINWDKKLFNSVYSMTCEMAVTDWEKNHIQSMPKAKERIKTSIILSDEAIGFSDPDFWGEYNIIEPEKSIESAIKKIQRQLKRSKNKSGTSTP
ncbi:carboxypeptidase-like regulatory domain-containing protein [uncultured Maribacter sp.]|uniref:carboxypeptidase-like regulatory domain-containing protein n=1 Tax=uncultured Maribacter sp. TaxID=431308 RepID=UPI00262888FC|nr:carboxypeptidase-like regulatory domain-containing protein [uncultured Maribacter sp.]